MSGKPDDIPQDVWGAADNALDNMLCNHIEASGSPEQFRMDITIPIARAILAERERCAKVAEYHAKAKWGAPADSTTVLRTTARSIAAIIREVGEA